MVKELHLASVYLLHSCTIGHYILAKGAQAASHSLIPVLQSIVIVGVIAGVGLIGYDVLSNRK